MPQTRRKGGKKHFLMSAAEKRRFDDVADTLVVIAVMRDKDDFLTANATKLAQELQEFADALAKPLSKRKQASPTAAAIEEQQAKEIAIEAATPPPMPAFEPKPGRRERKAEQAAAPASA